MRKIKVKKIKRKRTKRKNGKKERCQNNIFANKIIKLLVINIMSLFTFLNLSKKYDYCYKCIQQGPENLDSKCFECPNEVIFKGFKIMSALDTLNEILKYNRSISRYGDGEYNLMQGGSIIFQKKNESLSEKLKEIIISNKKNLLVGIYSDV